MASRESAMLSIPLYGLFLMYNYLSPRAIVEAVRSIRPRVPPDGLFSDTLLLSGSYVINVHSIQCTVSCSLLNT